MKSSYERREFSGAAIALEDLPHCWPRDAIEGFLKVVEYHPQGFLLLFTLFLDLSCREDHVNSSSVGSETTLTFGENFL